MSHQITVGAADELGPGQRKLIFVDGQSIVLFNIGGAFYAVDNTCPHNGASLASGRLEGCVLRCPAHGLRFDLRTGRMAGTDGLTLTTFPVSDIDGKLIVSFEKPGAISGHERSVATTCSGAFGPAPTEENKQCKV